MVSAFRDVDVMDIDTDDLSCVATYRPDMAALQRSIADAGVLTPLHLRALGGRDKLQLVSGWKRVTACRETGRTHVPALIHDASELSDEAAFLLAVHENLGCRTLNAVEKGRVLRRLQLSFEYSVDDLVSTWCPRLGIPPQLEAFEDHCRLITLDTSLQEAVVIGHLPLETALWIGEQATADREVLQSTFTQLKLGQNRTREFVTLIDEICLRDECGVVQLWEALDLAGVLHDPDLSGPQRVDQLRRRLRMCRYPRFQAHEQAFEAARRELRLPSQISLQPPPYFDGSQYHISFRFGTREALQAYAQKLLDAAEADAIETLLGLL